MLKTFIHTIVIILIALSALLYIDSGSSDGDAFPARPVRVIVPFNPGGGTDTYVRILQKAIKDNDLMPQPLVILNKPGGGATIGSTYVKDAKNDGYTLLCLHEALLTSKVTGQSPHGPEAFESVAATGENDMLIIVNDSAPFRTMKAFMDEAKSRPETLKFGVNFGTPTHFAGIQLENTAPGARFRLVSAGGGANRLAALMGGHLDAAIFSVGEFVRFRSNGLRALAYLREERHEEFPDIPTAEELGYPVNSSNLQYWWYPKGTDSEIVDYMANILKKAMETEYAVNRSNELQIEPRTIVGQELQDRIDRKMRLFGEMKTAERLDLPDVVFWAFVFVAVFGVTVFIKRKSNETEAAIASESLTLRFDKAFGVVGMCVVYVSLMGFGIATFVWATSLFLVVSGLYLTNFDKRRLLPVFETAFLLPFGLHFVFTKLFAIQLP
ncbi:MAG TPA: hypothetical protein DIV79_08860 [Opitutae bacterium]|nr:hypothetical protein [Opitutaceae bacterium]HCR30113.1 hypothetical protein [Opitutae bacterium]